MVTKTFPEEENPVSSSFSMNRTATHTFHAQGTVCDSEMKGVGAPGSPALLERKGKRIPAGRGTAGRGQEREGPLNRGAGAITDVGLCVQPMSYGTGQLELKCDHVLSRVSRALRPEAGPHLFLLPSVFQLRVQWRARGSQAGTPPGLLLLCPASSLSPHSDCTPLC